MQFQAAAAAQQHSNTSPQNSLQQTQPQQTQQSQFVAQEKPIPLQLSELNGLTLPSDVTLQQQQQQQQQQQSQQPPSQSSTDTNAQLQQQIQQQIQQIQQQTSATQAALASQLQPPPPPPTQQATAQPPAQHLPVAKPPLISNALSQNALDKIIAAQQQQLHLFNGYVKLYLSYITIEHLILSFCSILSVT